MNDQMDELKRRLGEIYDLHQASSLLNWDQSTYMPPGGGPARGRQMALLARIAAERSTDPALGRLLDELRPYEESLPYDSDEASLIRVARRDFERAVKVPPAFTAQVRRHASETYQVWVKARPDNDFKRVQPYLEKTLDYSRELANFFPGYQHIADPLIDRSEPEMTAAGIRQIFAQLREQLVPLVTAVISQPPADEACLQQDFPVEAQLAFGEMITRQIGYDYQRGRLDLTHHPFTTKFSVDDVRITTRVHPDNLGQCLFACIHEAGHAMYEQGVKRSFEGTPLARGASSGLHESQSRLWENLVGRSRPFWGHYYPALQAAFPSQLGNVPLETFYKAINRVRRSLIRTEADEVTYNLHVMLRFDLELALLEGSLEVKDLPEAWRERFKSDLGIVPPDDKDGVMQDVHWYFSTIGGGFQGYTLGNILGALIYETALQACPEITPEIGQGKFSTLLGWLQENMYQHGRKFTPSELVRRITGGDITIEPYLRYLKGKYAELYGLPA